MARPRELLALLLDAPREAGTPAAAHARRLVTDHLQSLDYRVIEQPFSFFPSSLNALPMFGAGLGWLTLIQIPLVDRPRRPRVGGARCLDHRPRRPRRCWCAAPRSAGRRSGEECGRTRTSSPPGAMPRCDAGSSPTSTPRRRATRWRGASSARALRWWPCSPRRCWRYCGSGARWRATGGLRGGPGAQRLWPRRAGRPSRQHPGAPDNGSGLLAALVAAEAAPASGVGVLITGAEEFGLVGARVFAREYGPQLVGAEVVNLDTIDDQGSLYIVSHDAPGARFSAGLAGVLGGRGADREGAGAAALGLCRQPAARRRRARRHSRSPGSTGARCRRMHTVRDTPAGLEFQTAEVVGSAGRRTDLTRRPASASFSLRIHGPREGPFVLA